MLRKDKVYNYLIERSKKLSNKEIEIRKGFSAAEIAKDLELSRNNVSTDLNSLYREGKLFKSQGKPTLYMDIRLIKDDCIIKEEKTYVKSHIALGFENIIGYDGSLAVLVKQAQAAILYPPNGLPTLILGQTGTGKTAFADSMYRFAITNKVLKEKCPYVVFNCADYANNPQLIMSILFGSTKGAYTGSSLDKVGLVEEANEGILFLDEVHRLPPEGQEMLFTLMDRGTYRRLGDITMRHANVLIIAATTEEPNSTLLKTFLRRFPIVINMPFLKERGIEEKFKIVSSFFMREAKRVGKPITVTRDSIMSLLLYNPSGNIGELKSIIELLSSRAYLDYIIHGEVIKVVSSHFPDNVLRDILYEEGSTKRDIDKCIGFNDITFYETEYKGIDSEEGSYNFSSKVYDLLKYKNQLYKNQGILKEEIEEKLYKDLENMFKNYKERIGSIEISNTELSKFLTLNVLNALKLVKEEINLNFNFTMDKNTFLALAFHVNSLVNRKNSNTSINTEEIKNKYPKEYEVSKYIIQRLENLLKVKISTEESALITLILTSLKDESSNKDDVIILVIAHGKNTASSMVDFVNTLLGTENVVAIDMALEDKVSDTLNRTIELCRKVHQGKGILLMVDMGSLKSFGKAISEATGIEVLTIDNVSMPSLLQAAHKSMQSYNTLHDVALSVVEVNESIVNNTSNEIEVLNPKERIIFAVCSTGEGTSSYVKAVIEKILDSNGIRDSKVLEMSVGNKKDAIENMKKIAGNKEIIAIAGSINPEFEGIPFINLIELVNGNGINRILKLITNKMDIPVTTTKADKTMLYGILSNALDENLSFISGKKVMPYLDKYVRSLEQKGYIFDNHKYTIFIMHTAYLIERYKFSNITKEVPCQESIISELCIDFNIVISQEEEENIRSIINA